MGLFIMTLRLAGLFILAVSPALPSRAADGVDTNKMTNIEIRAAVPAPAFNLLDWEGRRFSSTTLTGQAAVVTFWAVGDKPSERQMAELNALQNRFPTEKLSVVSMVVVDNPAGLRKYMTEHRPPFPVLLADLPTIEAFGRLQAVPTTFVIDKNYNIIQQYVGFTGKADIQKYVEAVLKQ